MLGNHADAFFRRQANERVVASTPNSHGGSFSPPDQELAGTKTAVVRGNYEMPGPQNQVDSGYMPGRKAMNAVPTSKEPMVQPVTVNRTMLPGMGNYQDTRSMLPGMGNYQDTRSMLPGMGYVRDMLPGMGQLNMGSLAVAGVALGAIWYLYKNKAFA